MSLPDLTQYGDINEDIGRWGYTICTVLKVAVEIVAAVTLVMLTYIGLSMMGADDPKTRTELKARMVQVFAGFCVVVVAVSFVNLLANGNMNPIDCRV
ncbi:MAG: hypothetical protein MSIBF_01590 [Candidatus Altiarchaeales archaeon IMC4]|nr:MAG: hypothetical protein MSIBF_01590 [Candidatus Altiarchaeales archaeon IMC4]